MELVENSSKRIGRPRGIAETKPRLRLRKAELADRIARLQSRGIIGNTAHNVIEALGGDEYFLRIIGKLEEEGEYGKVYDAMQFLLQMRDGRPSQRINITATQVHVTAQEALHAASVVRELLSPSIRGELKANAGGEQTAKHNAFEGEGGKRDG